MNRRSFFILLFSLFIISTMGAGQRPVRPWRRSASGGHYSLFIVPILAQEGLALQISPVLYELTLAPGETKTVSDFEFFNPSEITQEPDIFLYDFVISDEMGGIEVVEESHTRYSLSRWLEVQPEKLTLEPRGHQAVDLTIRVPDNAEPGGHYGALFGKIKPPTIGGGVTAIGISAGVAAPLLLTVTGPVSYTGEIIEFKKVPFVNLGPVDFLIRFKNDGTVHYSPHGIIEIFDWLGNKTDVVTVPERRVFPETIRQLPATWDRRLLIGKYRALATIYFGAEDERKGTAEIEFWAFPYKPTLVFLGVIVILFLVGRVKKRLEI